MIDCSDLARSADFWARVLGYVFEGPAVTPTNLLYNVIATRFGGPGRRTRASMAARAPIPPV